MRPSRAKSLTLHLLLRASDALASRAWLALFTLMLFLGLAAGLVAAALRIERPAGVPTTGAGARGGITPVAAPRLCAQLELYFTPQATEGQIRKALIMQDALIVYGPNENGAFEVRVPTGLGAAAKAAFEKLPPIERAITRSQCP